VHNEWEFFSQFPSKTQTQFFHLHGQPASAPLFSSLRHVTVIQSGGQWKLSSHGVILQPTTSPSNQPTWFHELPFTWDWEVEIHVVGLWMALLADL